MPRSAAASTLLVLAAGVVAAALSVSMSVQNSCSVFGRADGHAQLWQSSVQVPQLLGSLLFLVVGKRGGEAEEAGRRGREGEPPLVRAEEGDDEWGLHVSDKDEGSS